MLSQFSVCSCLFDIWLLIVVCLGLVFVGGIVVVAFVLIACAFLVLVWVLFVCFDCGLCFALGCLRLVWFGLRLLVCLLCCFVCYCWGVLC